jgi:S1-C subfamily serine protease
MSFVVGDGEEILRIKAKMVTATNPINPGESGGPLFNQYGELVGVTESGRQGVQAVNNFIDVSEVRTFLRDKKITFKELLKYENDKPKADEKAAAQLLNRAKLFSEGDDNRSTYIAKLKDVVAKYPKTGAAKQAQEILDQLK